MTPAPPSIPQGAAPTQAGDPTQGAAPTQGAVVNEPVPTEGTTSTEYVPEGMPDLPPASSTEAAAPAPPKPLPPPPTKQAWTDSDLEALKGSSAGQITWTDDSGGFDDVTPGFKISDGGTPADQASVQEMLTDADARIAALEQERLAAVNPFLRGTAKDDTGKARTPRAVDAIDADLERWKKRRDDLSAQAGSTPPAPQP